MRGTTAFPGPCMPCCMCSRLKELALLSHSQLVAGIVAHILRSAYIFGKRSSSHSLILSYEVLVSAGLSSQTAMSFSASSVSWHGSLLTRPSRDWQDLAAAFLFLFSCSLLPITRYKKKLILHLRAFMRSYKYRILTYALTDVSDNNREIAPLSLARSS